MFAIGEKVTHYKEGVCEVVDIGKLNMGCSDKDKEYYTLRPYYNKSSTLYMPVDGKKNQLRKILSRDEAEKLIASIDEVEEIVIKNEKLRESCYKEALFKNESFSWVALLKTSYKRKKERLDAGKKVINMDERYLNHVEKFLYGELALVLDLNKEEIKYHILQKMTF